MRALVRTAILIVLAVPVAPLPAQETERSAVSDQDRARGHRMLQKLRETLERYYYDSTFHGIDLARHVARTDSAIDRAASIPEMSGAPAEFLHVLDDSHTRFLPPGLRVSVEYGWSWIMIGDDCYVAAVTEKSDAARAGLLVGDRVVAIDGIRPTRRNQSLVRYFYYDLSPRPGMRLVVDGGPDRQPLGLGIRADDAGTPDAGTRDRGG